MEQGPMSVISRVDRTLFIFGEISSTVSGEVIEELHRLELTKGDISIVLQSDGGDEVSGYAIYDAITMCKNKVIITGFGEVSSIAAVVLQAGDWRRLMPHATFLIHNGGIKMNVDEDGFIDQDNVIELADRLKKDNRRYYSILCDRSYQPEETVRDWCMAEEEFTAEEAVNVGFADELVVVSKHKSSKKEKGKRK